jgi:hypothetical protein
MRKLNIHPELIVLPGRRTFNKKALGIYYNIYSNGHQSKIPPVIVINGRDYDSQRQVRLDSRLNDLREWGKDPVFRDRALSSISELTSGYQRFNEILKDTPYCLIDGSDKAVAAAICHVPVDAVELNDCKDIDILQAMIQSGQLLDLKKIPGNIADLLKTFEEEYLGDENQTSCHGIYRVQTVTDRVIELMRSPRIPIYMRQKYNSSR